MLKQNLQQKLQQKLSPQQIMVIRLLEVPALELEERISQEIEENPAIEVGSEESLVDSVSSEAGYESGDNEDFTLGDYRNEDEIPDYKLAQSNYNNADKKENIPFSVNSSLHEYLIEQLHLHTLPQKEIELAEYVIGNIDQDGYLRREVDSMVDDYSFQVGFFVEDKEMQNGPGKSNLTAHYFTSTLASRQLSH